VNIHTVFVIAAASAFAAGCSATTTTRVVEPTPVAQRTVVTEQPVYQPATTTVYQPATPYQPATRTVYTNR
jgi:uncharacterized lipoprotein YajG